MATDRFSGFDISTISGKWRNSPYFAFMRTFSSNLESPSATTILFAHAWKMLSMNKESGDSSVTHFLLHFVLIRWSLWAISPSAPSQDQLRGMVDGCPMYGHPPRLGNLTPIHCSISWNIRKRFVSEVPHDVEAICGPLNDRDLGAGRPGCGLPVFHSSR